MLSLRSLILAVLAASTTSALPQDASPPTPPLKKFRLRGKGDFYQPDANFVQTLVNGTDRFGYPSSLELYTYEEGYANTTFTLAGKDNHLKIAGTLWVVLVRVDDPYMFIRNATDVDPKTECKVTCGDVRAGEAIRCRCERLGSNQFRWSRRSKYSYPIALFKASELKNEYDAVNLFASAV